MYYTAAKFVNIPWEWREIKNPYDQRHGVDEDEAAGEPDEGGAGGEEGEGGGEEGGGESGHTPNLCTSGQGKSLK